MSVGEPMRRIHQVESDGDIAGPLVKEGTRVGSAGRLADDLDDVERGIHHPRKVWNHLAMDLKSYSPLVRLLPRPGPMFAATDTAWVPWYIAHTDVKKRGRLNNVSHLLRQVPYEPLPERDIRLPKRQSAGQYREFLGL